MNNVQLMGRLTRDAEVKYLDNNQVARFTLAVDKGLSKDKKEEMESQGKPTADFINCQAWGKIAENISKYTGKGLRVLVNGSIQTGSYEKDGQRVYTTEVLVNNVEFIDWKNSGSQNGNNSTIDDDFEYSEDFDPTEDKRIPF